MLLVKTMNVTYKPLTCVTVKEHIDELDSLLQQLSGEKRTLSEHQLCLYLDNPLATTLGAFVENKLVGIASVYLVHKATRTLGFIEDVVVDEHHRGHGIATGLMKSIISLAKEGGASQCNLTSHPTRIEANHLYQKLGFKIKQTNVYRLSLE